MALGHREPRRPIGGRVLSSAAGLAGGPGLFGALKGGSYDIDGVLGIKGLLGRPNALASSVSAVALVSR